MKLAAAVPALFVLISLCGSPVPPPGGSISGTEYYDANRNGIRDSCDGALSGVTVVATAPNGTTAAAVAADDGTFHIEHAPPGDDRLSLRAADGFAWPITTTADDGSSSGIVHVDELKDTPGVEIGSASRAAFGLSQVTITGILFNDTNLNGVVDKDECGIDNARSAVQSVSSVGGVSTTVQSDGTYELRGLSAVGDVQVNLVPAAPLPGFPSTTGSPSSPADPGGNPCSYSMTPRARYGANSYEADLGFTPASLGGSFSGMLFDDANKNGVRDSGEAGLAQTGLYLTPDGPICGSYAAKFGSVSSDITGHFEMFNVPPGRYIVRIGQSNERVSSFPVQGWPDSLRVTVRSGQATVMDLPVDVVRGATIRVHAFDDVNGNGVWDDGEPALPGLDICTTPPTASITGGVDSSPSIGSTSGAYICGITDAGGAADLGSLLPGRYGLTIDDQHSPSAAQYPNIPDVELSEGQNVDEYLPVRVVSAADQIIPAGSGADDLMTVCYSDPTWVQPAFTNSDALSGFLLTGPLNETPEKLYTHGIYAGGDNPAVYVWLLVTGLHWQNGVPECAGFGGGPMFYFANYEPVSAVTNGSDIVQVVLRPGTSGLWAAAVPAPPGPYYGTGIKTWFLFVDENQTPLARCNAASSACEWYNGPH